MGDNRQFYDLAEKILHQGLESDWPYAEILEDDSAQITISLGDKEIFVETFVTSLGHVYLQKDNRVGGEVWRVHKGDADPFPSRPHAHCVGGRSNFIGRKLHLGTRQLFDGSEALDRYLHKKPFARLIELIRPKFPEIKLPLDF